MPKTLRKIAPASVALLVALGTARPLPAEDTIILYVLSSPLHLYMMSKEGYLNDLAVLTVHPHSDVSNRDGIRGSNSENIPR